MFSFRNRIKHQESKVPISKEVREFIVESREFQTVYMCFEEAFSRKRVTINEIDHFKNFVAATFYGKESYNKRKVVIPSKKEADCVQKIVEVVEVQAQLYSPGEIHYSVIWVCFWEYSSKKFVKVPLLKIYKARESNNAASLFIDIHCNVYQNWNHCIDTIPLPHSFVCVPRFGEYNKIQGLVDLEYILFDGWLSKGFQFYNCTLFTNFTIIPWLNDIKSVCLNNLVPLCKILIQVVIFIIALNAGNTRVAYEGFQQLIITIFMKSNQPETSTTDNSTNSFNEILRILEAGFFTLVSFYKWLREKNARNFQEVIQNASNLYNDFTVFTETNNIQPTTIFQPLSNLNFDGRVLKEKYST